MKKYILLLFTSAIICNVSSQCLYKGITTNPGAPVNNELPSKANLNFDWKQQYWQNNSTCQPLIQIESPFFKTDNLEILRASKDMLPEDGWELIRRDFGYTDQNTPRLEAPEHIYFILYNKHTGVLRVLLKTCRVADYNGAKMTMRFDATSNFQSGLLNFSSTTRALDITHVKNPAAQSASVFVNDRSKWFYADFPTAYDPCTCNYASKINIISELIQNSSILLEGSITGTITSITNGQGSVKNDGSYSFKDFVNGADKFKKGYSSVDNFISETKNVAATIPNSTSTVNALTQLQNGLKNDQFLKTGLAAVPWLKSASGLLDFFIGGGKTSPQQVQIMPMAVNLSMRLSGTMTTSNQYHNIIFSNPGSLNAPNDPDIYPFYNEILGVFNLIKGPVFYKQTRIVFTGSPRDGGVKRITHIYRRLKEPMKWVLNPASKLELQDAQVAYVALTDNRINTAPIASIGNGFDFLEGKNAETGTWQYRTEYVNLNCLGIENIFHFESDKNITPRALFIKFILNFKRLDNPSAQNVLLVLTYPIGTEEITQTLSGNDFSATRCSGGAVSQATAAEVGSFCSSTQYSANRTGRRISSPDNENDNAPGHKIEILPNPATDRIVVKGTNAKTIKAILLYNAHGALAMSSTISMSGTFTRDFNISTLNNGVYFLNIMFADGTTRVKKIIISK